MAFRIVLFILLVGIISCQPGSPEVETSEEAPLLLDSLIIGKWENVSLTVDVATANSSDSSYTFLVPTGQWENKLGIRPIQTSFSENNTYRSEYYNLDDSLVRVAKGIWNTFTDTLLLIEADGTYEYICRYRHPFMEFRSVLDWDGDGELDDTYMGVQQRVAE